MRNILYILIFLNFLVVGCTYYNESKDVIGNWRRDVEYSNLNGLEYLSCMSDSSFLVIDSLLYEFKEQDVSVSVKCLIKNSGYWSIDKDSLKLELGKYEIEIDSSSLKISTESPSVSIDTLQPNFNMFKSELCNQIQSEISNIFKNESEGNVLIGKIERISSKIINIKWSDNEIQYVRFEDR